MTDSSTSSVRGWSLTTVPPANSGGPTIVQQEVFPEFENIPVFNIRNGDTSDAAPILVRPTIPTSYHWVPIGGLDHSDAITSVGVFIKCADVQLQVAPVYNMAPSLRKKVAICIGVSRAVMTAYYRLSPTDLIEDEMAPAMVKSTKAADGTITYTLIAPNDMPGRASFIDPLNLTDVETAVIGTLLSSSIGTLPIQGYSLMMTGHHYLSEAGSQSRRAYATIEKQFWRSAAVREWFSTDLTVIQDACWHKSGHPVRLTIKAELATSHNVANMLRKVGAGSAACRLPVLESPLRSANSYANLIATIDPFFKMFDGPMKADVLCDIIDYIKAWPRGEVKQTPPPFMSQSANTREKAVAWLDTLLNRNVEKVAFCYGLYCALSEQNATLSSGPKLDTLKMSYSLSKLKNQCMASY